MADETFAKWFAEGNLTQPVYDQLSRQVHVEVGRALGMDEARRILLEDWNPRADPRLVKPPERSEKDMP